ncbi:MAG: hypothetical protein M3Z46_08185 [Actinomycetota bacterium]|nr:hypothetical protein [Actinomycetota bacterium]
MRPLTRHRPRTRAETLADRSAPHRSARHSPSRRTLAISTGHRSAHLLGVLLTIVATASITLVGCGVSGKTSDDASSRTSAATTTEAPPQTTATTEATTDTTTTQPDTGTTDTTETTQPDAGSGDTTIPTAPDGNGTTVPDSTNPFGTGDIRNSLIRTYKQLGFTDKEARCVTDLVVRSGGGTFDPGKLDIKKLGAAAQKCFGADGAPGGSD